MDSNAFNYVLVNFGLAGVILVTVLVGLFRLGADLARLRTDLQQQLARDLLTRRFEAYSRLWTAMKPLAIYSDDMFKPEKAEHLLETLSAWYFSDHGGLFLTARARDFYFVLQQTLEAAGQLKGWKCTQRPDDMKAIFRGFLAPAAAAEGFVIDSLDHPASIDHAQWLRVGRRLAQQIRALPADGGNAVGDAVFATLQQVSSALRTTLSDELQTRLEPQLPRV